MVGILLPKSQRKPEPSTEMVFMGYYIIDLLLMVLCSYLLWAMLQVDLLKWRRYQIRYIPAAFDLPRLLVEKLCCETISYNDAETSDWLSEAPLVPVTRPRPMMSLEFDSRSTFPSFQYKFVFQINFFYPNVSGSSYDHH